ncbi:PTS-dependent dihydroxyacetone kinase phosphotransferase subunit DhaM [Streptomyces sp. NPDC092296]|uniref:PTS-dependent dihydroxyacetone kinase phosphotransferase subunit DhaM n=1 Tax=Streptomyces sp. NPDC092296 TaxID=3366012 RepID=UPI0038081B25
MPSLTAHPAELDRVGVVLVSHSREVALATAALAIALVGNGDPAPVGTAGGREDGGLGVSQALVLAAAARVDQGMGVVVLADLGGAVPAVRSLLAGADENGLPFPTRFADAPFVEGAVAAVVTASAGGDLAAVVDAAEDTYRFGKS